MTCGRRCIGIHVAVLEQVSLITTMLADNDPEDVALKTHEMVVCSRECFLAACAVAEFIKDIGRMWAREHTYEGSKMMALLQLNNHNWDKQERMPLGMRP